MLLVPADCLRRAQLTLHVAFNVGNGEAPQQTHRRWVYTQQLGQTSTLRGAKPRAAKLLDLMDG